MNADEALKRFVEENLTRLTSGAFSRDEFKRLQRAYFTERFHKRYGLPGLKDITHSLVKTLLANGIAPEKVVVYIETLPVFRDIGDTNRDSLRTLATSGRHKSLLDEDDLATLKQLSAFQAVERHKGREIVEAKKQELSALDEELRQKQEEYDALPSVLDEESFPEPDFDPVVEDVKPWWERFYLKANPFPRKDGLSAVDNQLYDSVVVKTGPFTNVMGQLHRNPDLLFNTAFMLTGSFGFGKTTFMDYLSYQLIRTNAAPIRVTCGRIHANASAFLDAFYLQLRTRLQAELSALGITEAHSHDMEIEDSVLHMCRLILGKKRGLIVFLDDYHKHSSAQAAVFEFLGMLQILKDNLTRAHLKVGFVVSGLPEWQQQLLSNTRLSGFLDSPSIAMPAVTPATVAAVFNQRIAAYCYDTHARTLRLDFVESVFQSIGSASSYRDYLNRIISELEHNNFSIVNTPIELDDSELLSIKGVFEGDNALKASLNKLVFESKFKRYTTHQVNRCLELLVQASLQGGVSERDALFNDNLHYFQHLRDLTLIQKQKSRDGTKAFRWVVHSRFRNAVDSVESKFRRGVSDYLLKLYAGQGYRSTPSTIPIATGLDTAPLSRVLADSQLTRSVRDSLLSARQLFESIQDTSVPSDQYRAVLSRASLALDQALSSLFELDGSRVLFAKGGIERNEVRLQHHWAADEAVEEVFRRLSRFANEPNRVTFDAAQKQANEAFVAIAQQLGKLHQDITDSTRPVPFRHRAVKHTGQEMQILQSIERDYFSADSDKHFEYVERITNYLEERFRAFLFVTTTVVYGEQQYFEIVPKGDKKYAHRNMDARTTFSTVGNLFNGLTRPQFRSVFTQPEAKRMIVDALLMQWSDSEWKVFWDLFVEENIATSHKQHSTYSPSERDRYARYCRMAEELTAKINYMIANIIERNAVVIVADVAASKTLLSDCIFRFGFQLRAGDSMPESRIAALDATVFKYSEAMCDHSVVLDTFDKVTDRLQGKLAHGGSFSEDVLDIEYIRNHYDASVAQFLCCLAYAAFVRKSIAVVPWFGSSVLIKPGSRQ